MSFSIRLATPTDAPLLPAIERSAAQTFVQVPALAWIAEHTVLSSVEHLEFVAAGLEWVVVDGRDRPIGFVCASAFDESLHIEELAVDHRIGFFVNHDLAGYEVPVHADIPHQEVIFLDETDPVSSPMKAKGVGELGICGVSAAVANAIYNATGARVREYPITLDKILSSLPEMI